MATSNPEDKGSLNHTDLGLPLEAAALLLAVDFIMDMARTATNVIGNSLATVAMAKSEGLFIERKNAPIQENVAAESSNHRAIDM